MKSGALFGGWLIVDNGQLPARDNEYILFHLCKNRCFRGDVKAALEAILNCKLVSYQLVDDREIRHCAEMLGVVIELGKCDCLEDDGVIAFSEYQFEIDIEFRGQARLDFEFENSWREAMAIALANMLPKQLKCECIAVYDLQRILRTFPEDV